MSTMSLASIGLAAALFATLPCPLAPDRAEERAAAARTAVRALVRVKPLACIGTACDMPMPLGLVPAGEPPPAPGDVIALWRKFALNALLAPLLDDSEPVRWAPPTLATPCAGTSSVLLDGQPLRGGAPLPEGSFVLRWRLDDCAPLTASWSLRGHLEVRVHRESTRLRALVSSDDLVVNAGGRQTPAVGPFAATLLLQASLPGQWRRADAAGAPNACDPQHLGASGAIATGEAGCPRKSSRTVATSWARPS